MFLLVENIISDLLLANVGQEPRCPVILVGHSFGGLVLKKLCLRAFSQTRQCKKLENLLDNLTGMFFYATPHHGISAPEGISFVDPGVFMAKSPLLAYVQILSKETARLNSDFDGLCAYRTWRIAGLGENLPSTWGRFHDLVVSEASSRHGTNFNVAEGADHISISRPPSKVSRRFTALTKLVKDIAMDSHNKRPGNFQELPDSLTGVERILEEVKGKLKNTRRLGFHGMGGIGKTTLVMALFNDLERFYDCTCFIKDVKDITGPGQKVLDTVLVSMHYRGKKSTEDTAGLELKMRGKTLLLVLDDVNSERDLNIVAKLIRDIGIDVAGSRFVATSRNKELFAPEYEYELHAVELLSPQSSKDLFLTCAPDGRNLPFQNYVEEIVKKCDRLPLTLQVVGKHLHLKRRKETDWKLIVRALDEAKNIGGLNEKLWAKLKISYDGLDEGEKSMFLDATTVFYKSDLSTSKAAWSTMDEFHESYWQRLVDLSLVWEVRDGERTVIGMHEQLLSLGRKIALTSAANGRTENGCRIWNDSRKAFELLSADNDSVDVNDMKDIVALKCCARELDPQITGRPTAVELAPNYVTVSGSQLCLMKKLHYLWLEGFDIDQTHDFKLPSRIVYLHLSDMSFSEFSFNPSRHRCMAILSLSNVRGVRTLPADFHLLKSLQILTIEGNDILERLPDSFGNLPNLTQLILERCPSLKMLPYSLGQLVALETLRIGYCESLSELPISIGDLFKLKDISITGCSGLEKLPVEFLTLQALEHIELNETSLLCVPDFKVIKSLKSLRLGWERTAQFPHALPECLREMVTESGYKYPVTFNVVDGIFEVRRGKFRRVGRKSVGMDAVLDKVRTGLRSVNSLGMVEVPVLGKMTPPEVLFKSSKVPAYEIACFLSNVRRFRGSVSDA
ncbi:unnamed protein product [Calypogeia fissa]